MGLLAVLAATAMAEGAEPTPAKPTTVAVTATVVPPPPRLVVSASGDSVMVHPELPPSVELSFSVVPMSDGRWTLVLAVHDGKTLATYQYPLAIGNPPPAPPPPGPTPPPTPVPSGLAKLSFDAAMETVPAAGRAEQAIALAGAMEGVLKRCDPAYSGEDKIADPAALRSAMPAAVAKALAANNDRWLTWAQKVAVEMDRMKADGKLADLEAYRAAYTDIIRGLREVK